MKRTLLFLALSLFTTSAMADAGDSYNFRFHPINLLVGSANASLDIRLNEQWTLGPEASYWNIKWTGSGTNPSTAEINTSSIGARANWFKQGVFNDGLYVGPFARYAKVSINATGTTTVTGDASGLYAGALVGYGWFWESFNMMLGAGASAGFGESNIVITESSGTRHEVPNNGVGFTAEYTLGWTF